MVFTDFSFLRERDDPALVPVIKKFPESPVITLSQNPACEKDVMVTRPSVSSAAIAPAPSKTECELAARSLRLRHTPRIKSFSASGPVLEKMVPIGPKKAFSTGDLEDLRRVGISGFTKNKFGTWMFKVDVSTNDFDSYAVRRRFSDFKELHDGLQELLYPEQLPELPHHGIYSVVQLFFSPEAALSHRAKQLEELLQYVNEHPVLSKSAPFIKFLGQNPSRPDVGYVSLSLYEAPSSDGSFRLSSSRGRIRSRRQST